MTNPRRLRDLSCPGKNGKQKILPGIGSAKEVHGATTNPRRLENQSQSVNRKRTSPPVAVKANFQIHKGKANVQIHKAKKIKNNLHNLWKDLFIFDGKVKALIEKKEQHPDEVEALGKDIATTLLTRQILKKEHLLDINPEVATSPKRLCSGGSQSPEMKQGSDRICKSQTRLSRRDKHDDIRAHLDFDDEETQPAVKRGVNEDLFIENVELRKEISKLTEQLNSNQGGVAVEDYNGLSAAFTMLQREKKELESKLAMEKNHTGVLEFEITRLNRESSHGLIEMYRSELSEAKENYNKLGEDYKRMKDKYERKIVCQQYEQQKLGEKIHNLQTTAAGERSKEFQNLHADAEYLRKKLDETEETLRETTASLQSMTEAAESYKRTNDNQQKYILELQNRNSSADDEVVKDANVAIVHYKEETGKYRKLSDQAKSENLKLKMEKDELLTKLKKLRADAKEEINKYESDVVTLRNKIRVIETEKKEKDKVIENQTTELKSVKDMLTKARKNLDQQDMKRYEKDCMKQKHEKEALEDQLMKMENQYATQTEEHIESEQKLKHEMNRYRNERNRLQTKVESLGTEVSDLTSKFKEQQVLFTLEKEKLESDIERLEKHLYDVEHVQIQDFSTRASDYQKEAMDKKNEELVRLTRKLYHVEEDLKSYKEQVVLLETKDNEQREIITRFAQQLKSSEDRTNAAKRLSDIEKENASLKRELTEAVQSLERNKDYKDRYDRDCNKLRKEIERLKKMEKEKDDLQIDNNRLNDQINQLQVQWDKLKSDREQEKAIAEEVMNLKEQKFRLENDKHLMRQEILSLQEKVKSADEFRHSNEILRSEVESLKASNRGLQTENRLLEDKCKSETTARITRDDLSSRYKEDCERLRKERNTAQHDLVKISREKEELVNRLRTEFESLKLEVDKTKNEKAELGVLYKAQLKKEEEKIKRLEKQNEILQERTSSTETNGQHQAYELLQLKNDYEICKVQKKQLEEEIRDLKQEVADLENKQESTRDRRCEQCPVLQREIESLKKRLSEQVERNSNEGILSRKVQELQADNRIQKEKLDEMERRKCKLCDELSHKLSKAETEVKEATRRLEREEKRSCLKCDDYERKLSQAKQDNQELQDKFNVARTNAQNTGRDVHDLRGQIESEKSNIKSLQRKVENLEKEKFSAESALHDKESELSQVRGELASLDRRINCLQDENTDLNRRCKSREEGLVKMDAELRQLKTQNRQLESDMVTLRQEKETLVSKLEMERVNKLELQERLRNKSSPVVSDTRSSCPNCWKYRNDISELRRELDEMRDRLSEAAGNKLRDNNPNIADLSDMNRPTSLAEKFSSLYTDEYTDAMEAIEDDMDEPTSAGVMLKWLKQCYEWCERLAREQREKLTKETIGFMRQYHGLEPEPVVSQRCLIYVKEFQKKIAQDSLVAVFQICQAKVVTEPNLRNDEKILKYIKRCTELCWMMQITDPPLYLNFSMEADEKLDKNIYNVFTKSGSKIDYLVWPIIYLHKDGPMLGKGVAQGR